MTKTATTTEVLDYLATKGYKLEKPTQDQGHTFVKGTTNYGDPIIVAIAPNGDYNIESA